MCLQYIKYIPEFEIDYTEYTVYKLGYMYDNVTRPRFRNIAYPNNVWCVAIRTELIGPHGMRYNSGFHVYPRLRDALYANIHHDIIMCKARKLMYHGVEYLVKNGSRYGNISFEVQVFEEIKYVSLVSAEEIKKCRMENLF